MRFSCFSTETGDLLLQNIQEKNFPTFVDLSNSTKSPGDRLYKLPNIHSFLIRKLLRCASGYQIRNSRNVPLVSLSAGRHFQTWFPCPTTNPSCCVVSAATDPPSQTQSQIFVFLMAKLVCNSWCFARTPPVSLALRLPSWMKMRFFFMWMHSWISDFFFEQFPWNCSVSFFFPSLLWGGVGGNFDAPPPHPPKWDILDSKERQLETWVPSREGVQTSKEGLTQKNRKRQVLITTHNWPCDWFWHLTTTNFGKINSQLPHRCFAEFFFPRVQGPGLVICVTKHVQTATSRY